MAARGRPQLVSDEVLLDAARDVFVEHGVGATTVEIARRAHISESVLFHRYKTKEALFQAVVERQVRIAPILEQLVSRAGKGRLADNLFDVAVEVMAQARAATPLFVIGAMMQRGSSANLCGPFQGPPPNHELAISLLKRFFDLEIRKGRMRKVPTETLARVFIGALAQRVLEQYLWNSEEATPARTAIFVRELLSLLLEGAEKSGTANDSASRGPC